MCYYTHNTPIKYTIHSMLYAYACILLYTYYAHIHKYPLFPLYYICLVNMRIYIFICIVDIVYTCEYVWIFVNMRIYIFICICIFTSIHYIHYTTHTHTHVCILYTYYTYFHKYPLYYTHTIST